jgi:hypothetical protein
MSTYKVHWKASTREVRVLPTATATPGGFTNLGTFDHIKNDGTVDAQDELGWSNNHAFYHHVRDKLYGIGVQDMQSVNITTITLSSVA